MEKKLILSLILLLSLVSFKTSLFAQSTRTNLTGFVGQIEVGLSWAQVGPINEIITHPDSQFLPFDKSIFSFGFGVERYFGRVIYGGNIYTFVSNAPGQDQNRIKLAILNYYYGTLKLGYVLYQSPERHRPLFLYPSVGIGGGTSLFRVSPNGTALYQKYYGPGVMVDGSLNFSFLTEMPDGKYSLKIGGRFGYMYAPGVGWDISEYNSGSSAALPLSPQGFYFRVSLGMGKLR